MDEGDSSRGCGQAEEDKDVSDVKLTKAERSALSMFGPDTYGIKLGAVGAELEKRGLVRWVPPVFGGGHDYVITDAGRAALTPTVQP